MASVFEPRKRQLVEGPLVMPCGEAAEKRAAAQAASFATVAARFAQSLLLEDEVCEPDASLWLSRWGDALTGAQSYERLRERAGGLAGALAFQQLTAWYEGRVVTKGALAHMVGVNPNHLFDEWRAKALLMPFLAQAFAAWCGWLPRIGAFQLFAAAGVAGGANRGWGIHKETGLHRATVLGGLAGVSGDTVTPVSLFPIDHGTHDDPAHPDFAHRQIETDACAALAPFGLKPDGTVAGFARMQFDLLREARAVLKRAAERDSDTCRENSVDPEALLRWGLPGEVLIGRLRVGASGHGDDPAHIEVLPGLDADILRSAGDLQVLAHAFDHMSDFDSGAARQLLRLSVREGDTFFTGLDVLQLLGGTGRWEIPGLDDIPSKALRYLSHDSMRETWGVAIDGALVQYLRIHERARLVDSHGPLPVNLLARVRDRELSVSSTLRSLADAPAMQAVMLSDLHFRSVQDATRKNCLARFFITFKPHVVQPAALTTRTYMGVVMMLANLGVVGQLRCEQALGQGRGGRRPA